MGELEERIELVIKKLVAIGNTLEKMNRSIEKLRDSSTRIERRVDEAMMKTDDILENVEGIAKATQELRRSTARLGDVLTVKQEEAAKQVIDVLKEETESISSKLSTLRQFIETMENDLKGRIDVFAEKMDEEWAATREAFRRIETILCSCMQFF